jgi:PAS domain S-box-containing protein
MSGYVILIISILIQFTAAALALRLVWITKQIKAWAFISGAIFLMALRRCFTLQEWISRGFSLTAIDISTEVVGLSTSILMLAGVAFIAPLFLEINRSKEELRQKVEERTTQLKASNQALQIELDEREHTEKALRESEERFRTLADFTYDWEYWLSPDGSYNYITPSVERITGYQAKDFFDEPGLLERITHPEDRERLKNHIQEELNAAKAQEFIFRIFTKSGEERWIGHVCQSVFSSDGRNLGRRASNRNMTRYKQAEEEKVKLESQLRQAQKMEAIGTLAGGIAHDFNNILSPIIMYTEITLRASTDENLRPYLEQVLKSSRRASDLVKQILSISRQTEQKRILMQLGPVVKESLKLLRASFPSTIEIRQDITAEGDWILADPTEIYQVVMNLCTNAAHAMADRDGILAVSLDTVDLEEELPAYANNIKPGAYVRLAIHDTGYGMSPKVIERIFEPYFTTKEVGQGTGLGLALVHSIVQTSNGGITISSEPGQGSTFSVYLPKIEEEEDSEVEVLQPIAAGKGRLLLVDDEVDIVNAAKIILEQSGYEVVTFTNSLEAWEIFQAESDKFDLIISDLTMPRMTGLELAKKILTIRPQMPIIICTGFSESITSEKAKELGIREVILKPIIPQHLTETIGQILEN